MNGLKRSYLEVMDGTDEYWLGGGGQQHNFAFLHLFYPQLFVPFFFLFVLSRVFFLWEGPGEGGGVGLYGMHFSQIIATAFCFVSF